MSAVLLGDPLTPKKAPTGEEEEEEFSFLLVDEEENLQVKDVADFIKRLRCSPQEPVKVLSIFGNTGDGKSHTLNHMFYGGLEIFRTSPSQDSCTVGVWAAYYPELSLVLLDTEGLLGATDKQNQRLRLLLKVLAVSDLVIYRTRAERLHNDMFQFLGNASKAYLKFFTPELKALSSRCGLEVTLSSLGPSLTIFQETSRTDLLGYGSKVRGQAETDLLKRFHELGTPPEAFSAIHYVGTKTVVPPTDFSQLMDRVKKQIMDTSTRSSRPLSHVFTALQSLSERFSGDIPDDQVHITSFFPDEYFTCSLQCLSCRTRCKNRMNHMKDGVPHQADGLCKFAHEYNNKVFICKTDSYSLDQHNAAQRVLDGVNLVFQSVNEYSAGPTNMVTSWLIDNVAPTYWRPNAEITVCQGCKKEFTPTEGKHHCRSCGEGFCHNCSNQTMPVPDRGWGPSPVRVCKQCHNKGPVKSQSTTQDDSKSLLPRKVTEIAQTSLDMVSSAMKYPLDFVKEAARPSYWVSDQEITNCHNCKLPFTPKMYKHHCRSCGQGFCQLCSEYQRAVPSRGWHHPVRVCQTCSLKKGEL